ncbi:hypothetical protein LOAG_02800 [Loa loa]|uniref:Uncharacterized protein n=1 Tax=Loa loa TaxID=7209 RepID=A0A1S0U7U1_LOALO|nr:hypothetical protein LOAG_02800 [Loa loa]EFO25686.2 hypothetical protein LOAG_02800 [Loa loa]
MVGNQSEILDEPITIEPSLGITTLQTAHPSELPRKSTSSGEIIRLQQQLCDLKTSFPSSGQSSEPHSVEIENFLNYYHPQHTIYTDVGFQINEKCSNQNAFT